MKSLLEELSLIVKEGRREAEQLMDLLESGNRSGLQTRELVTPVANASRANVLEEASPGAPVLAVAHLASRYRHDPTEFANQLIHGDNLLAMGALLAGDENTPSLRGEIHLIYIDPPYDSKADYRTRIELPGLDPDQGATTIEQFAYSDIWEEGTASYLKMMTPRLFLMRELLAETGSIYVHIDWRVSHYLKIILDEIFGRENFANEIIRRYSVGGKSTSFFARKHDTILFYAKDINRIYFNGDDVRIPFTPHKQDRRGKNYGGRMGVDENGRPYVEKWGTGNKKRYRYYLDAGKIPEDVWEIENDVEQLQKVDMLLKELKTVLGNGLAEDDVWDAQTIQSAARERTNYATQKPEKLLERIIKASCPKEGIVADFFCGSGTALAVAERNGRKWLGVDQGQQACLTSRKRLVGLSANPFLIKSVDNRLNSKDGKLNAMGAQFSSPRIISIRPVLREPEAERETLTVELDSYAFPSPEALNLNAANTAKLQRFIQEDPMALIDYWSIDPDYDGKMFRSGWQDYRGKMGSDRAPYRVVTRAVLTGLPRKPGKRLVCVRVVDVLGFETETVQEVQD